MFAISLTLHFSFFHFFKIISVRAYADACAYDQNTGRPIAGYINFSPSKLDAVATSFPTAIHELFHVLGFKSNLFETFRDEDYNELKPHFIISQNELG